MQFMTLNGRSAMTLAAFILATPLLTGTPAMAETVKPPQTTFDDKAHLPDSWMEPVSHNCVPIRAERMPEAMEKMTEADRRTAEEIFQFLMESPVFNKSLSHLDAGRHVLCHVSNDPGILQMQMDTGAEQIYMIDSQQVFKIAGDKEGEFLNARLGLYGAAVLTASYYNETYHSQLVDENDIVAFQKNVLDYPVDDWIVLVRLKNIGRWVHNAYGLYQLDQTSDGKITQALDVMSRYNGDVFGVSTIIDIMDRMRNAFNHNAQLPQPLSAAAVLQQVADDIFKNPYRDGGYDFIPLFQQIDGLVFDSYKEELDQVVSKPKEYNRFELKRQNGQVNAIASRRIDFAAAFGKTFALGPSDTDGYLYAAVKPDFELYGQPTGKLAHLLALMDIRRIYESINNGLLRIRKKPEKDTDGDIKPLRP